MCCQSGWTWIKHFLSFSLRLSFFQRFFVNEAYWQSPDGPVFLFIGGEGPIYEFDVLAGTVGCSACPHLSSHTFEQQIGWKRKRENAWMNKGSVWHTITGLEMKMETVSGASCCVSVRRHFANTFFTFHSVRTRYQISQRLHRPHIYLLFQFWISIQPFFTVFQLGILLHAYSWHFCLCKMSSLQYKVDVKENQTIYQHRRNRCTQKSLHVAHHVSTVRISMKVICNSLFSLSLWDRGFASVVHHHPHIHLTCFKICNPLIEYLFLSQKRQHHFHAPDNFEI